jgi:hypothetical protein
MSIQLAGLPNTVRRKERLLPGGATENSKRSSSERCYDPQAILALPYAGCRVAQLKGVTATHDNILLPLPLPLITSPPRTPANEG